MQRNAEVRSTHMAVAALLEEDERQVQRLQERKRMEQWGGGVERARQSPKIAAITSPSSSLHHTNTPSEQQSVCPYHAIKQEHNERRHERLLRNVLRL